MNTSIRLAEVEDVRPVTILMKGFEQASSFIKVDVEHACSTYEKLVGAGGCHILMLEKNGLLIGALGFIIFPDLHDGKLTAVETFWFVDPKQRGRGITLFNEYEIMAKEMGCKKLAMIHMEDSYPERLKYLYTKKGYKLIEQHYVKEI